MKQANCYLKQDPVRKASGQLRIYCAVWLIVVPALYSVQSIQAASSDPVNRPDARGTVKPAPILMSPGDELFGTIQEVIRQLEADPDTDWSKVNLEVLRRHLRDMFETSHNVDVVSQQPIDQGVKIVVTPLTQRARAALERVLAVHPRMLKHETGWDMRISKSAARYEIVTTTPQAAQIDKIRGLGYIGLMAYGMHHQPHHWAMATGKHPHQHGPSK